MAEKKVAAKYGNVYAWSDATLERMRAWGFNTIGAYAYQFVLPIATDASGRSFHKILLPFMGQVRPSFYSMRNPAIHTKQDTDVRFLSDPVKDVMGARSIFYRDYVPSGGIGDYYDSKMQTWLASDMSQDFSWDDIKSSPHRDFLLGVLGDDGDEMYGFMSGPDFPTVPAGKNNPSLALLILSESPVQTANANFGFVYRDSAMHTKIALRNMLEGKYKSVAALNTAWGSSYTTFDSSGTTVSDEALGHGDGATLTFQHVLQKLHPSRYSVQISLKGIPIGGDIGDGTIFGPKLTGTVNYQSGLVQLAFRAGDAPPRGASLTVSYAENGWGIGTGLMDEDLRPTHRAWLGNSWNALDPMTGSKVERMNPRVREDMDAFLKQTAGWYFKMLRDGVHAEFPKAMVIGELGSWDGVPPGPVLQAAAEYIDLFEDDESKGSFDQARLDFIARNYGDRPFISGVYLAANPDSALRKGGDIPEGQYAMQDDKGKAYASAVSSFMNSKSSLGTNPHVGFVLWAWMDMWSEGTNWGLVSHLDNAYDGHEDVSATVPCSPPLERYTCGGEPGNYGNYIGAVKEANSRWLKMSVSKRK
ncbi:MAG TPA: hypothetical protein VN661_01730 [Candidatus Acidoferrales bacterium]|nr:hypothetical protein [Candidatus Acidoferrales bacterium]